MKITGIGNFVGDEAMRGLTPEERQLRIIIGLTEASNRALTAALYLLYGCGALALAVIALATAVIVKWP
jgi:uncharacterized membrane protein YhiD involved in acid resistance